MNMRILSLPAGFVLLLACIVSPAHAADTQTQPTPTSSPTPSPTESPAAERLDESGQPGITIRQGEPETQITEKRQGGEVREIKVRKSKNNTYVIRPGQGPRDASAQGTHTNPAQWTVKEFGPGKAPKKDKAPPPPPPAPAAPEAGAPDEK